MPAEMDPDSISSRFRAAKPIMEEMLRAAGAVGLSYGVLHAGKTVLIDNIGYRDVDKELPMSEETMFPICSMTKGIVTSALGLAVEDGKMQWTSPLSSLYSAYKPVTECLRRATLIDFLSMKSGLESYNIWCQSNNHIIFPKSESLNILNNMRATAELRARFNYNNWGYELASNALTDAVEQNWDSYLHERIFQPLGLRRTDAFGGERRERYENRAEVYMALDDGTPVHIPGTKMSGSTLMGAAGGVMSCVKDLLVLYSAMITAMNHQFTTGNTETPNSPFKQLNTTMSAHTQLPGPSFRESSYGLGWLRTELPNQMCKISPNYELLGEAPIVGEGAPSKLVIAHYGSIPGIYTGVNLFPETESAIVVLTNSTPICDISDWLTQLMTQTLFDFPRKNDYVDWVKRTRDAELGWHAKVVAELEARKEPNTSPRPLKDYVGIYVNALETFKIAILEAEGGLKLAFQARSDEQYNLQHHEYDTFSWLQTRNEFARRGRPVLQPASYFLLRFETNGGGAIESLRWSYDSAMPDGERFVKGVGENPDFV